MLPATLVYSLSNWADFHNYSATLRFRAKYNLAHRLNIVLAETQKLKSSKSHSVRGSKEIKTNVTIGFFIIKNQNIKNN